MSVAASGGGLIQSANENVLLTAGSTAFVEGSTISAATYDTAEYSARHGDLSISASLQSFITGTSLYIEGLQGINFAAGYNPSNPFANYVRMVAGKSIFLDANRNYFNAQDSVSFSTTNVGSNINVQALGNIQSNSGSVNINTPNNITFSAPNGRVGLLSSNINGKLVLTSKQLNIGGPSTPSVSIDSSSTGSYTATTGALNLQGPSVNVASSGAGTYFYTPSSTTTLSTTIGDIRMNAVLGTASVSADNINVVATDASLSSQRDILLSGTQFNVTATQSITMFSYNSFAISSATLTNTDSNTVFSIGVSDTVSFDATTSFAITSPTSSIAFSSTGVSSINLGSVSLIGAGSFSSVSQEDTTYLFSGKFSINSATTTLSTMSYPSIYDNVRIQASTLFANATTSFSTTSTSSSDWYTSTFSAIPTQSFTLNSGTTTIDAPVSGSFSSSGALSFTSSKQGIVFDSKDGQGTITSGGMINFNPTQNFFGQGPLSITGTTSVSLSATSDVDFSAVYGRNSQLDFSSTSFNFSKSAQFSVDGPLQLSASTLDFSFANAQVEVTNNFLVNTAGNLNLEASTLDISDSYISILSNDFTATTNTMLSITGSEKITLTAITSANFTASGNFELKVSGNTQINSLGAVDISSSTTTMFNQQGNLFMTTPQSITFSSIFSLSFSYTNDLFLNSNNLFFEYTNASISGTGEILFDTLSSLFKSKDTTITATTDALFQTDSFSLASGLQSLFNVSKEVTLNGGAITLETGATLVLSTNKGDINVKSSPAIPSNLNDYDITYSSPQAFNVFAQYFTSTASGLNQTLDMSTTINAQLSGAISSTAGSVLVTGDKGIDISSISGVTVSSSSSILVFSQNGINSFYGSGANSIISAQSPSTSIPSGSVVVVNDAAAAIISNALSIDMSTAALTISTTSVGQPQKDTFLESPTISLSAATEMQYSSQSLLMNAANGINLSTQNYLSLLAQNEAFFKTKSQNLSPSPINIQVNTIIQNNGDSFSAAESVQSFATGNLQHIAQEKYVVTASDTIDFHAGNQIFFQSTALNYQCNATNNMIFRTDGNNGGISLNLGTSTVNARNYNTVAHDFNVQILDLANVNVGNSFFVTNTNPREEIVSFGNQTTFTSTSSATTSVIVDGRFINIDASDVFFYPLAFNIGANNVLQNPVFVVDATGFNITSTNDVTLTSTNSLAQYDVSTTTNISSTLLTVNSNGDLSIGTLYDIQNENLVAVVGNFSVSAAALFEARGYSLNFTSTNGTLFNINGKGVSDGLYIGSRNNVLFEGKSLSISASQNFQNSAYRVNSNSPLSSFTISASDPVKKAGSLILDVSGAIALSSGTTSISTTKNNGKISFTTQNAESSIILSALQGSIASTSGGSTSINANYFSSASKNLKITGTLPNTGYVRFSAANDFVVTGSNLNYNANNFELTSGSDLNGYTEDVTFTASDSIYLQTQNGDGGNIYVIGYQTVDIYSTSPNYNNLVSADGNLNIEGASAISATYGSYLSSVTGFIDSYTLGITNIVSNLGNTIVTAQNAAVEFSTVSMSSSSQGNTNFIANNGFSLSSSPDSAYFSGPGISMTASQFDATAQAASIVTNAFNGVAFSAPDGIFTSYSQTSPLAFQFTTTQLGADIFFGDGINSVNINNTMTVNVLGFGEGFGTASFIFTESIAHDQPLSGIGIAANLVEVYASGNVNLKSREATISGGDIVVTANGGITISRSGGDSNYELIELVSFDNGDISFQTQYGGKGAIILRSASSSVVTYASYKTRFLNYNGGVAFSASGSAVVFSERNDEFPGIIFQTAAPTAIFTDNSALLDGRNINFICTGPQGSVTLSAGSKLNAIVNIQLKNVLSLQNTINGVNVGLSDRSGPLTVSVLSAAINIGATTIISFNSAGSLHYTAYKLAMGGNVVLTNLGNDAVARHNNQAVGFISSKNENSPIIVNNSPSVVVGGYLAIPYVSSITNHASCPYNRQVVSGTNTIDGKAVLCVCEDNVYTCTN